MALNVLVVDDSTIMRTMILKALGLTGLPVREVYQAANGQEVKLFIYRNPPAERQV